MCVQIVTSPIGYILTTMGKMLPSFVYLSGVATDSSLERKVPGIFPATCGLVDKDREGVEFNLSFSCNADTQLCKGLLSQLLKESVAYFVCLSTVPNRDTDAMLL